MYGLEHFLKTPSFKHVQILDFSSMQLETHEIISLCEFCCQNKKLKCLNLSDKVYFIILWFIIRGVFMEDQIPYKAI